MLWGIPNIDSIMGSRSRKGDEEDVTMKIR